MVNYRGHLTNDSCTENALIKTDLKRIQCVSVFDTSILNIKQKSLFAKEYAGVYVLDDNGYISPPTTFNYCI